MINWLLDLPATNGPSERISVRHHRILHVIGHCCSMGWIATLIAHWKCIWLVPVWVLIPAVKEGLVDGHLKRIAQGQESVEQLRDLRADLISWYSGAVGFAVWLW